MERMNFRQLLEFYRHHLLDDVVPFWLKHAVDRECGGLNTCIRDDGSLISHDKYMWSQLRAIWTFSALYNRIEQRAEWLDVARNVFEFAAAHGRDEQGRWVFRCSREGEILEGATSIYADGFAIYGFTEYARATGEQRAVDLALETYRSVQRRLAAGDTPTAPYEIPPGAKTHGISMIFSLCFHELGQLLGDREIQQAAMYHHGEVMDHFRRPERRMLFEYITLDNQLRLDEPWGRTVVPGHAIESMWFQIHIARDAHLAERIRQACECIQWHIELGWDEPYGGILLGLDSEGIDPPYWKHADVKVWWPHTEALYALLLAYEHCREDWCLEWYWKVHDYSFSKFPVPEHGEWTQRLDRQGNKIETVVALPVKDPFHLPRALIYCIDVLGRLADS